MRKLACKTRSGIVENEYYGYICLLRKNSKLDRTLNDQNKFFARSCIKAIQAKVCKDILKDSLDEEYLAMALASHGASELQLDILDKMLQSFSLLEQDLYCAVKSESNNQCFKSKKHHYCAGKHIALAAACKKMKLDNDYHLASHLLQKKILHELSRLAKVKSFELGIDGCGIPTFYMSLKDLAQVFVSACSEQDYLYIFKNTNKHPLLTSAQNRLDQELMRQVPGRFYAKSGAAGLILVLNIEAQEVLVVKLLDGDKRVKDIVCKKLLEDLAWVEKDSLILDDQVYSSQGHVVGAIYANSYLPSVRS